MLDIFGCLCSGSSSMNHGCRQFWGISCTADLLGAGSSVYPQSSMYQNLSCLTIPCCQQRTHHLYKFLETKHSARPIFAISSCPTTTRIPASLLKLLLPSPHNARSHISTTLIPQLFHHNNHHNRHSYANPDINTCSPPACCSPLTTEQEAHTMGRRCG